MCMIVRHHCSISIGSMLYSLIQLREKGEFRMLINLRDILVMFFLSVFVCVFTQFIRNYTAAETIGMIVFVIIVYVVASLMKKRK